LDATCRRRGKTDPARTITAGHNQANSKSAATHIINLGVERAMASKPHFRYDLGGAISFGWPIVFVRGDEGRLPIVAKWQRRGRDQMLGV
jgi:hypothetical protein